MTSQYGITILPLHRSEGIEQKYLPGLNVFKPPRRAARGRKQDRLLIYLQLEGAALRLSREQHTELLESAAKIFYDSPGSVTSALRAVVEALNDVILSHNMRGGQTIGALLNVIAVRDENLYIAQSGPAHCFLLGSGKLDYFYDAQAAGRGLGAGRSPGVRFFQAALSQGALFLVVPRIPKGWNEKTVQSAIGQSMGVAARRFLGDAGADLRAVLLEARGGGDDIRLLAANSGIAASAAPEGRTEPPATKRPAEAGSTPISQSEPIAATSIPPRTQRPAQIADDAPSREAERPVPKKAAARGVGISARLTPTLQTIWGRVRAGSASGLHSLRTLLGRMLPSEDMLSIPGWLMGFIAVIVPIVVVMIAVIVYVNIGRDQLYDSYLEQAQFAAGQAEALGTGGEARATWEQTLTLVEYTEQYEVTSESSALRERAQTVLDQMDGIVRLNFQPGVSGVLSPAIEIRRMVASTTDLYMLDINSGSVLRAWLTGTGYEMDPAFRCGPGSYGAFIVGPLIDMVTLSKFNPESATILAMDANGNLLYCIPGETPLAVQLTPPDVLWGQPKAITLDGADLYVMDPLTNAVWVYEGVDETFVEPPRFYFAAEVPSMNTAIDIAVNGSDLWILHSDGHTTHCVFNVLAIAPTACDDPASFTDPRAGYEDGPMVQGSRFFQIQRTLPPEPSVFFLDPITRSVYHFSLQLRLTAQYRSSTELPEGLATAFAVSPNRMVFIALDNQLYASPLP
jgi:hypothetical protein